MRTAAHAGIVHRDIKPANIILASARPGHDEPFCAKLCDFGLAKRWMNADGDPEGSAMGNLTANGMSLGTPHYMSPEQALGQRDLDQRTDIYSLGTVLFHCLTGATVHSGDDSRMIMTEQVGGTIDFTLLADQGVSEPLIGLLKRMLAKSCDQRPADWQALIDDLQRLTPDAVALVPSEVGPGTDRTDLWRTMAVIAWATLIAAVFMTIGGAMWWLLHG
jgi:serine/threonine-protein kinase